MRIDTPRGSIIKTQNGKAKLEWNPNFQPKWEQQYSRAQRFVDSMVIKLCVPYTPLDSNMLNLSAVLGTFVGSGEVIWIAPSARYLYYGLLMVSPSTGSSWAKKDERKVLTDIPLNYNGAPKRGKLWFERMKVDHKEQILKGAKGLAGGGQ